MSRELWRDGVMWKGVRPDGTIRHSQLVSTYGPGSLADLVDDAAIVSGLSWWSHGEQVVEDRLLAMLAKEADFRSVKLFAPPTSPTRDLEDPNRRWIKAFRFPEWFVCQNEKCWEEGGFSKRRDGAKPRRLLRINQLDGAGHRCKDGKGKMYPVQPIRFTRACRLGHIDDIEWFAFVHSQRKGGDCRRPLMWLDEASATGDLADVRASCICGASVRMMTATKPRNAEGAPTLGRCSGRRPWLGDDKNEQCGEEAMRFLLRSASHAYFPVMASVIHIPDPDADLRDRVGKVYELLKNAKAPAQIDVLRDLVDEVRRSLEGLKAETVFAEVTRRRDGHAAPSKKPKEAEVEALLHPDATKNNDRYSIEPVALPKGRKGAIAQVDRLVLLPRLTEVRALVGFTRFEAKSTDIDGELDIGAEVARIDDPMTWLPAVEHSGEGFFFSLREQALVDWEMRPGVWAREQEFRAGFQSWKEGRDDRKGAKDEFVRPRYVLLHSLAHLLITAVSLECGYAASSIRERIYAGAGGSGILLYTASPGAEGSLGGLVEVGRHLERYLEHALDLGRLCANDPVCAAHLPDHTRDSSDRHLEGASCHGCLLISEPSCERMNTYLDRTLVVPTVESAASAFFGG